MPSPPANTANVVFLSPIIFYSRITILHSSGNLDYTPSPMSLRVYNTLTREKSVFEPVTPGKVGMYLCGPTVYKPPHIGHMVGPVIFDAIKRYLTFKGYAVTFVVNITDVDDKLIDEAAEQKMTMNAIADRHTAEYKACLSRLGIDTVDRFPKASEHMPEIIAMCQTLIAKGMAYATVATCGSMSPKTATMANYRTARWTSRKPARAIWPAAARKTRPISHCGKPPRKANPVGNPPGAMAGRAGISNAPP
jgi:cysteinyl-tRNA synthetase